MTTYNQSASILGCLQRIEALLRELTENGLPGGQSSVTSADVQDPKFTQGLPQPVDVVSPLVKAQVN